MATKQAATRRKTFYNGTHGNMASETFKAVLSADVADTEFEMGMIPAGTEVTKLDLVFDALGAGTNIDVGYRYLDSTHGAEALDYWGNTVTATAGTASVLTKPMRFERPALLMVTLKGGAGTGELYVMPTAISRGVK